MLAFYDEIYTWRISRQQSFLFGDQRHVDLSKIWYVKSDKISYHFEQAENTLVKDRKKVTSHAQRRVTSEVSRKEIRYIRWRISNLRGKILNLKLMANLFPLSANTYFVTWITLFFFWRKYSTCISIENC